MKTTPASLQLRIGRVVWHGPAAPGARALEDAIQAALVRALVQDGVPLEASALARTSSAIASELLPRLPDGLR